MKYGIGEVSLGSLTKSLIPFVIAVNKNEPSWVGGRKYGTLPHLFCGMVLSTNC